MQTLCSEFEVLGCKYILAPHHKSHINKSFNYRLTDTHIYFHRSFIFIMEHKTREVGYIYYVSSLLKQNILIWAYSCVDFMVLCLFTLFLSLALTISAKNFEEPSSNIISGSCCKLFHTSRLNISFSVYN